MAWYSINKLSVTQGSPVVTGTGTQFSTFIYAGFGMRLEGGVYEIISVDSATQITLDRPYEGVTKTDASYSIWPTQGLNLQVWQNEVALLEEFGPLRNNMTLLNQQIADTLGYRDAASASQAAAAQSATDSASSAVQSKNSSTSSGTSAAASAASAVAAKTSETNSKTSETNAKASETAANTSKVAAASSAADALTNKNATSDLRSDTLAARDATVLAQTATEGARDTTNGYKNDAESAVASIQGFRDGAQAAQVAAEAARDTTNDFKNAAASSATDASDSEAQASADAAAAQTARSGAETARDTALKAQTDTEAARDTTLTTRDAVAQDKQDTANYRDAAQLAAARAQEPVNIGAIEDAIGGTPALLEGSTFVGPVFVPAGFTVNAQDSDQEGGQINLQPAPNQTVGAVSIDTAGGSFRVFDSGTTSRMLGVDLVNGQIGINGNNVYHDGRKPTKSDVGLGNADNTSDVSKPISTAQQAALDTKANISGASFGGSVTGLQGGTGYGALRVRANTASTPNGILQFVSNDEQTQLAVIKATASSLEINSPNVNLSGGKLNGWTLPTSGSNTSSWNRLVAVNTDGGSEVGYYIDFHADSAGSKDYDGRLTCDAAGNLSWTGVGYFNGGLVQAQGGNATIGVKSTTSGVRARIVAQTDGNVVMYRTDNQGNDVPLFGVASNTGPFAFNVPITSNGYARTNGIQSAAWKNIGQLDFSCWDGNSGTGRNAGWRNDNGNIYLLFSDSQTSQAATETAAYNGYRPLSVGFDGIVNLGHGLNVGGVGISCNAILNANSYLNVAQQANFAAPIYANANNGARSSIRCGDDAWLGDANIGHTISITSTSDGNQGKLCFGQSTRTLGQTGNDSYLRWQGDIIQDGWFRVNGGGGLYWEQQGRGIQEPATQGVSYGNITTYGSGNNGWAGFSIGTWSNYMANGGDSGIYSQSRGLWNVRFDGNNDAWFPANVVAYSDERLKQNMRPIDNVVGRRKGMAKAAIVYERDGITRVGFGAQTLELAVPEVVKTADDLMGTKSVNYSDMVAILAVDNQQQAEQIEALQNENAQLSERLAKLEIIMTKAGLL